MYISCMTNDWLITRQGYQNLARSDVDDVPLQPRGHCAHVARRFNCLIISIATVDFVVKLTFYHPLTCPKLT